LLSGACASTKYKIQKAPLWCFFYEFEQAAFFAIISLPLSRSMCKADEHRSALASTRSHRGVEILLSWGDSKACPGTWLEACSALI
jgi:hypothetical protein